MGSRRLPLYFLLGGVLAWQIWQHTPSPWVWRQSAGLSLVIVGFCFWLIAHIQLGASFSLTPQARVGHARVVFKDPQSHLCLWRHLDRRPRTLLQPALSSVDFCI